MCLKEFQFAQAQIKAAQIAAYSSIILLLSSFISLNCFQKEFEALRVHTLTDLIRGYVLDHWTMRDALRY